MCQPFQTPPSIEICRIYHYIAVLLPEHCFFCLQRNYKLYDPKLSERYYIVHPSITQFLKNKKHKKNTWHNPLHAFRKILPSIPPPSNVSRHFFPFLQRKEPKYLKCTLAVSRKTPIYFMCVKEMLNLWKDLHFCRAHFPSHGLLVFWHFPLHDHSSDLGHLWDEGIHKSRNCFWWSWPKTLLHIWFFNHLGKTP